ncbi:MAG TPA: hypothetical protein VFW00_11420 [Rhodocyclaceae bacterium]|nr:hypothetical protein [Rhodocyclaceae bacterium]
MDAIWMPYASRIHKVRRQDGMWQLILILASKFGDNDLARVRHVLMHQFFGHFRVAVFMGKRIFDENAKSITYATRERTKKLSAGNSAEETLSRKENRKLDEQLEIEHRAIAALQIVHMIKVDHGHISAAT